MWMASAIDFVLIFVSLELVTISFYVLVGFTRRNPASLEAAVKYLVLSAVATGFLVYGITWIFGATGETNLQRLRLYFRGPTLSRTLHFSAACSLLSRLVLKSPLFRFIFG